MDRDALSRLLAAALSVWPGERGSRSFELQLRRARLAEAAASGAPSAEPQLADLAAWVRAGPELQIFDGLMQVMPSQASRVDYSFLLHWLLDRAESVGPEQAAADLQRYVHSSEVPHHSVIALAGLVLDGPCDFGSGVRLLPWDDVPDSPHKRGLLEQMGWAALHFPRAALVRPVTVPVRHLRSEDMGELPQPADDRDARDALRCMGLVGPTAVYAVASWLAPEPWMPTRMTTYSYHFPGGFGRERQWTAETCAEARQLVDAFRALSEGRRDVLRVPIDRLSEAMRRRSHVDAAIDLGIVFESIFLRDLEDDRGELGFRLRVRGARLLGASPDERRSLYQLLGNLYTARSVAVHTGRLPEKVRGAKMPTPELLQQGFGIGARAIRRLIVGGDPDWAALTLS